MKRKDNQRGAQGLPGDNGAFLACGPAFQAAQAFVISGLLVNFAIHRADLLAELTGVALVFFHSDAKQADAVQPGETRSNGAHDATKRPFVEHRTADYIIQDKELKKQEQTECCENQRCIKS